MCVYVCVSMYTDLSHKKRDEMLSEGESAQM